jgi:hypothetical protein
VCGNAVSVSRAWSWFATLTSPWLCATMPPARTYTGMWSGVAPTVRVAGPPKVSPVKKSVQVPGGNQTLVVVLSPGVVTGATSMSSPSMYSVSCWYASACSGQLR